MHDKLTTSPTEAGRLTDPVCGMQVNADTPPHDVGRQPSPSQPAPA